MFVDRDVTHMMTGIATKEPTAQVKPAAHEGWSFKAALERVPRENWISVGIIVCLLVYAVLGLVTDTLVRLLEKGVLRWQPGR